MVRRLTAIFILLGWLITFPAGAASAGCTANDIAGGSCNVGADSDDESVNIWGNWSTGGGSGSNGGSNQNQGQSGGGGASQNTECQIVVSGFCQGSSPSKNLEPVVVEPTGPTAPDSASDLASFRPKTPTQFVEPNGWSLAGLETNFWIESKNHSVAGTLFGLEARVRFTPERYRWRFGDGGALTANNGGASWGELGLTAWSKTPSSHLFSKPGVYTVEAFVDFSAEYRFDTGGWHTVAGLVSARAKNLTVTVLNSDTVLVEQDCLSGSIGCGG